MEIRQLEYLVAVVDEASFTRAAERLHVTQPGVSAQLRQLERELGQPLLDRSGRAVRPTQAGTAVLPYARAALQAVAGARLAVDELTGLVRGRVAVGMVTACSSLDLADLLADFHRAHPAVEITLVEAGSDRLLAGLQDGCLDLAFVGLGPRVPPGIEVQVVIDEPIVAAVARCHPLARRRSIALDGLREVALISLPPGTGLRSCLDDACARVGFRPRVALEASNLDLVARLAGRGLGVAVLPRSTAAARPEELHPIAITRPRLRGRMALAWRGRGPSGPAARALIERARTAFASPGSDGPGGGDGRPPGGEDDAGPGQPG
ncbi:MAG TPA: LysR substrate-binding domain-containing protein [Candidatus Dormibacteraeota bacterium]|nr:LysR substrate-binding domain-containing protein [Candidatus Dormibacteraeota bacterium]